MIRGLLTGTDKIFSLLQIVQTGFVVHPASYVLGIGILFSGGKAAGAWILPLTFIYRRD
jgi:hypothetical protein